MCYGLAVGEEPKKVGLAVPTAAERWKEREC